MKFNDRGGSSMSFVQFVHNSRFSVRLNKITVADDERAFPHQHGCDFVSIGLLGSYTEDLYEMRNVTSPFRRANRGMFNVHRMNNDRLHKIAAVSKRPAYTLFITFNYAHKPPLAYGPNGEVETMGEMYRRLGYGRPSA